MRPLDPALLRRAPALRAYLAALGVLGAASAGLILAQAVLLSAMITRAALGGAGQHELAGSLRFLLAVVAARALVAWLTARAGVRASAGARAQLRSALLAGALRRGPAWLAGERAGELALTATTGLDALDGYVTRYLPQLVLAVLVPVALLARVAWADPTSALTMGLTLPLIPVFMVLIGKTAQQRMQSQWALLGQLSGHFLDIVEGLPTLRVFGRARAQVEAVRRVTDRYRAETMSTLRIAFLSALVLELLATLSVALVAVSIGLRLVQGRLDLQTALLVLLLAPEVYLPLRQVGMAFHACADGLEAAARAMDIAVDEPDTALSTAASGTDPAASTATVRLPLPPHVRVCDLTVRYPGRDLPALTGVSFDVAAGAVVALTGPSGIGKSTVLAALLGFVPAAPGTVCVDGHHPAELDRAATAWVPQRPRLPGRTVAEVVRLGSESASDTVVRRALADVGADFVRRLDDEVGEDGIGLSTGQRRRLALARALLRVRSGARLVLLDEPSEGLDAEAEAAVRTLIGELAGSATVVLVTHSAALASIADRTVSLAVPAATRTQTHPTGVPA